MCEKYSGKKIGECQSIMTSAWEQSFPYAVGTHGREVSSYVKKILKASKQFKFSFPPRNRSTTVQQRSNYTSLHFGQMNPQTNPCFYFILFF